MKRIVAISLLIFVCIACASGQSSAQKPKDWAKFGRYERANADLKSSGRRPDAVFMGNSITDNWAKFDSLFFAHNNFVGRGISGQTSSQMLVRFRRDVLDLRPRAVVIMAGTNDIAQNNGVISHENILGNIASMCELAKAHKIKVILCSVPPAAEFRWRREMRPAQAIAELNAMLREYAESEGIYWLDYHSALADERGGMPRKWCADGVHPNMRCYAEIFEPMVLKAVNKVLRTKHDYVSPPPEQ